MKIIARIWDKQEKRFLNNAEGPDDTYSDWQISPFGGSISNFLSKGDSIEKLEDSGIYWDDSKAIRGERYVTQLSWGLVDKTGARIYEGDIVEVKSAGYSRNWEVMLIDSEFCLIDANRDGDHFGVYRTSFRCSESKNIKIIGNIFNFKK